MNDAAELVVLLASGVVTLAVRTGDLRAAGLGLVVVQLASSHSNLVTEVARHHLVGALLLVSISLGQMHFLSAAVGAGLVCNVAFFLYVPFQFIRREKGTAAEVRALESSLLEHTFDHLVNLTERFEPSAAARVCARVSALKAVSTRKSVARAAFPRACCEKGAAGAQQTLRVRSNVKLKEVWFQVA